MVNWGKISSNEWLPETFLSINGNVGLADDHIMANVEDFPVYKRHY